MFLYYSTLFQQRFEMVYKDENNGLDKIYLIDEETEVKGNEGKKVHRKCIESTN